MIFFATVTILLVQREKLNPDYRDVLKLDIEGSEFEVLDRLMTDWQGGELPVGQVLMEIHLKQPSAVNFATFIQW